MSSPKLKNSIHLGFTLLEVMIALAIMGMSLLFLFQAQTRSMRMADKARMLTITTELARKKLIDCQFDLLKKGFSTANYVEHGNFADNGFEEITWECFAYRFDMPPPSPESIAKGIKAQSQDLPQIGGGAGGDFSANMLAPFFGLIATTLGDSVRELTLIVRWKDGEIGESMKVVTHVIDRTAMVRLAAQLPDKPMLPPGMTPPGETSPGEGAEKQPADRTQGPNRLRN